MYHKIFPAYLSHLYEMLAFIKAYPLFSQFPSSISDQIILATEEALVNIIHYGYPKAEKGIIDITCENINHHKGLKIIIKDQGVPFNPIKNAPSLPPKPSDVLDDSTLGGYGIYIVIGIMDQVEYQRIHEENFLSLVKYF